MRAPYTMIHGVFPLVFRFFVYIPNCRSPMWPILTIGFTALSKHTFEDRVGWFGLSIRSRRGSTSFELWEMFRGAPSSFFLALATKRAMEPSWKLDKAYLVYSATRRKNGAFKTRQGFLLLGLLWGNRSSWCWQSRKQRVDFYFRSLRSWPSFAYLGFCYRCSHSLGNTK